MRWITSGFLSQYNAVVLHTDGLCAFRAFLVSEHSEENIAFYLACEDYKNTKTSSKLCSKAKKIYQEFIDADAQREVIIPRPRGYLCVPYRKYNAMRDYFFKELFFAIFH